MAPRRPPRQIERFETHPVGAGAEEVQVEVRGRDAGDARVLPSPVAVRRSSSSSENGDISVGTLDWRGTRTPVTGLARMYRSRTHHAKERRQAGAGAHRRAFGVPAADPLLKAPGDLSFDDGGDLESERPTALVTRTERATWVPAERS